MAIVSEPIADCSGYVDKRHTFASNLLEHGAEVVRIRDFLGQSQIASSERYAKVSSQKIKQEYLRTMQKILKQGQV